MLNYELTKKLKDAGFPFEFWESKLGDDTYTSPTLSELIEACGDRFGCLAKKEDGWYACPFPHDKLSDGIDKTPEEAVANLWLELNE